MQKAAEEGAGAKADRKRMGKKTGTPKRVPDYSLFLGDRSPCRLTELQPDATRYARLEAMTATNEAESIDA